MKWWHGPPQSSCKAWWKSNDARQRERTTCDAFHFFVTGRKRKALTCRYCFYSRGRFSGLSPCRGDTLHVSRWNFAGRSGPTPAKFHLDRLRDVGLRPQKISNFTNIIASKGWVPCTIVTKFIRFMRAFSLHNSTTYGCFSSINDKIINNLHRWGRFQTNFLWP